MTGLKKELLCEHWSKAQLTQFKVKTFRKAPWSLRMQLEVRGNCHTLAGRSIKNAIDALKRRGFVVQIDRSDADRLDREIQMFIDHSPEIAAALHLDAVEEWVEDMLSVTEQFEAGIIELADAAQRLGVCTDEQTFLQYLQDHPDSRGLGPMMTRATT